MCRFYNKTCSQSYTLTNFFSIFSWGLHHYFISFSLTFHSCKFNQVKSKQAQRMVAGFGFGPMRGVAVFGSPIIFQIQPLHYWLFRLVTMKVQIASTDDRMTCSQSQPKRNIHASQQGIIKAFQSLKNDNTLVCY